MRPVITIITKNEEHNIGECLKTIPSSWKCVVVDSGSTDNTIKIAKTSGATVVKNKWLGFGLQKQFALDILDKEMWVISLDADERLTPQLVKEISSLNEKNLTTAFEISRHSFFKGQPVRFSGWRPDFVVRLFHTSSCHFNENLVHESVQGYTQVKRLNNHLLHYPYRNEADVKAKIDQYGELGNKQIREKGAKQGWGIATLKATWSFTRTYIIRLGILDGATGWEIAKMNCKTTYRKYSKRYPT